MVIAYFIGILFTLAATAVVLPLLLAGHLGHEEHKKQIHHFHFTDKLRIAEAKLQQPVESLIKCGDRGSHPATMELISESVA
jgi:hypothetical protein